MILCAIPAMMNAFSLCLTTARWLASTWRRTSSRQERFLRSISLNAHYIVAFNNPRDTLGLRTLAQQAFAEEVPFVWEDFEDATPQPFGYLMLDLHPRTAQRYREKGQKYCLRNSVSHWSTWTRKPIKQTNHCLSLLVDNMAAYSIHLAPVESKKKSERRQDGVTL